MPMGVVNDADFQKEFSALVEAGYSALFGLHGPKAWALPADKLISFFRGTDQTSAIVGQRQATTFQVLAGLAGHGEPPAPAKATSGQPKKLKDIQKPKKANGAAAAAAVLPQNGDGGPVGLTVRIEINLPAAADQSTYDLIFKSIRENLLRG